MRAYDELRKRQQRLFLIFVALFIVVAAVVGPLSNRYSSAILTAASVLLIAATVVCMVLIGRLGFRCPRCGTFHSIITMTSPPQYCPKCDEDVSSL
jgi:hypothetical protein